ncbi:MAG TPA: hypothetical protein H9900_05000 [Candidatus Monoglobus merdigallinarum]|uniref:Uncharacterized protein n=1 Tax=Candidatus Monoglobus merdigallinarum TaxID=2838698 RepID=A0A9D1PR61_9FIRM|nr:hypothetical protein [Candidatus Monoglobus merdigallinarum]
MLKFGNKKQRSEYPDGAAPIGNSNAQERRGGYQEPRGYGGEHGYHEPQRQTGEYPESGAALPDDSGLTEYIRERTAEIDRQVEEFSRKNPGFDIRRELRNPQFCTYVWENGLSIEDAYYLTHRREMNAFSMPEQRRITENGAARTGGSGMLKKNPAEMSDEEIDEIAERVRRGEKISF